jgi:signal transduction histidine kinase
MKRSAQTGAKLQVTLIADDGSLLPVQISIQELAKRGFGRVTISIVVTDMTETHRNQELLRALTHRVVQVQETERGRVALELHDNITQLLCAVMFRSQALVDALSTRDSKAKQEAAKLHTMLGRTAAEVERISRDLRPNLLDQLGLAAAIRSYATRYSTRTGIRVSLTKLTLPAPLPGDMQLALYRIAQEAFRNIEKHARASEVEVSLRVERGIVVLTINDNGIGFDAITVALLGRSRPVGILLAGLLFGAFKAGGFTMQSSQNISVDLVLVVQSLIVLFLAAPPLVRAIFRLPSKEEM